uniref:Uncharacterized protein n=1 Tax=Eutreptiella gymnastica TaxID=73025 RepID=A0A7S1JCL5_9EUGL
MGDAPTKYKPLMAKPVSENMGDAPTKHKPQYEGLEYAKNYHYLCAYECYDGEPTETSCLYGLLNLHGRCTGFSLCFCRDGGKYPLCSCQSVPLTFLLGCGNVVVCCPVIAAMVTTGRGYQSDDCNFKGCCYHYNYD